MAALYNRLPIFDKVIYAGILAFSIYDYARLIDTGSVDRTVALLCLVLNCVIMYVIYSLVKTCMKYMVKPHLIDIRNEFRDEGNDRLPAVISHTEPEMKGKEDAAAAVSGEAASGPSAQNNVFNQQNNYVLNMVNMVGINVSNTQNNTTIIVDEPSHEEPEEEKEPNIFEELICLPSPEPECDLEAEDMTGRKPREWYLSEEDIRLKKECEEKECLERLERYALHYLGAFLSDEDKEILLYDIHEFASKEKPKLEPMSLKRIGAYHSYDIFHLCHAIGYHTTRRKLCRDIAVFAYVCFPYYTSDTSVETIEKKLTVKPLFKHSIINVVDRREPLPEFDSAA